MLIDPACLDTLPPRQLRAGYAEVVKYGLIGDAGFFAWCEANGGRCCRRRCRGARRSAIAVGVPARRAIVAEDERETAATRALLNLGHTFGHALEAETGFPTLCSTARRSRSAWRSPSASRPSAASAAAEDAERVSDIFEAVGLPTTLRPRSRRRGERLAAHMRHDKKASGGRVPFILVRGIGQAPSSTSRSTWPTSRISSIAAGLKRCRLMPR